MFECTIMTLSCVKLAFSFFLEKKIFFRFDFERGAHAHLRRLNLFLLFVNLNFIVLLFIYFYLFFIVTSVLIRHFYSFFFFFHLLHHENRFMHVHSKNAIFLYRFRHQTTIYEPFCGPSTFERFSGYEMCVARFAVNLNFENRRKTAALPRSNVTPYTASTFY